MLASLEFFNEADFDRFKIPKKASGAAKKEPIWTHSPTKNQTHESHPREISHQKTQMNFSSPERKKTGLMHLVSIRSNISLEEPGMIRSATSTGNKQPKPGPKALLWKKTERLGKEIKSINQILPKKTGLTIPMELPTASLYRSEMKFWENTCKIQNESGWRIKNPKALSRSLLERKIESKWKRAYEDLQQETHDLISKNIMTRVMPNSIEYYGEIKISKEDQRDQSHENRRVEAGDQTHLRRRPTTSIYRLMTFSRKKEDPESENDLTSRNSVDETPDSMVPLQKRERQWIEWVPIIENDIENFSMLLSLLVDSKMKGFLENRFVKELVSWIGKDSSFLDMHFWDGVRAETAKHSLKLGRNKTSVLIDVLFSL